MKDFLMRLGLLWSAHAEGTIGDQISNGILTAKDEIVKVANPIGVISLILMGLYLLWGQGDPQSTKKAKTWALCILVALVIINLAQPIIDWAQTIGA